MSGTNVAKQAAVAQSVERRLGKAEVTGSIPVSSFIFLPILKGFRMFRYQIVVKIVIKNMCSPYFRHFLCLKIWNITQNFFLPINGFSVFMINRIFQAFFNLSTFPDIQYIPEIHLQ